MTSSLRQRSKLNAIYASHLPQEFQLPAAYQLLRFKIKVENQPQMLKAIFEAGLFASSHDASLAGIMADGKCPHAEALHESVISLSNDHHFDEAKAGRVCEVIMKNLA